VLLCFSTAPLLGVWTTARQSHAGVAVAHAARVLAGVALRVRSAGILAVRVGAQLGGLLKDVRDWIVPPAPQQEMDLTALALSLFLSREWSCGQAVTQHFNAASAHMHAHARAAPEAWMQAACSASKGILLKGSLLVKCGSTGPERFFEWRCAHASLRVHTVLPQQSAGVRLHLRDTLTMQRDCYVPMPMPGQRPRHAVIVDD
jgi:hypothetical protein